MPKLPAVAESLDAIPEPHREFYVETDGKYVLDADVDGHPAIAGLKSALDKERRSGAEWKRKAAAYEKLGLSPEEIGDLKAEHDRAQADDGKGKLDIEKVLAKRIKELEDQQIRPAQERAEKAERELRQLRLTDRVRAAALEAEVIPEDVDDVLLLTTRHFDLDDKGAVVVLDDDGDPTGQTPKQWFAEQFKKRKPKFFKGTSASGSGARTSDGSGSGGGVVRLSRQDAKDPRKYQVAKARAEKDGLPLEIEPAA